MIISLPIFAVFFLNLCEGKQLARQGRIIFPVEEEEASFEERFPAAAAVKPRNSPLTLAVIQRNTSELLEPPPGQRCAGRNYQDRRCCTPEQPCGYGEGDCDGPLDGGPNDGHDGCAGNLVCGSNNCLKFGAYYHPKDDCCDLPETIEENNPVTVAQPGIPLLPPAGQRCRGRNYDGKRCCTPENPCDEGEGDCDGPGDGGQHDGDEGCKGDLVCGSNNCKKFGHYFHAKDDCCERAGGYLRQVCVTESGNFANTPCVFPFVYHGVTYHQCTWTDSDIRHNQPWCATRVDSRGEYISSEWGNCAPGCPTLDDNPYDQDFSGPWSQWSVFGPCSASCGGGTTQRSRSCSSSQQCPHTTQTQTRSCNLNQCSVVDSVILYDREYL